MENFFRTWITRLNLNNSSQAEKQQRTATEESQAEVVMLRKQVKELNAKTSDAKEAETLSKKVQEQAREIETLNIQVRA